MRTDAWSAARSPLKRVYAARTETRQSHHSHRSLSVASPLISALPWPAKSWRDSPELWPFSLPQETPSLAHCGRPVGPRPRDDGLHAVAFRHRRRPRRTRQRARSFAGRLPTVSPRNVCHAETAGPCPSTSRGSLSAPSLGSTLNSAAGLRGCAVTRSTKTRTSAAPTRSSAAPTRKAST